jgi:hypothetical protein
MDQEQLSDIDKAALTIASLRKENTKLAAEKSSLEYEILLLNIYKKYNISNIDSITNSGIINRGEKDGTK